MLSRLPAAWTPVVLNAPLIPHAVNPAGTRLHPSAFCYVLVWTDFRSASIALKSEQPAFFVSNICHD
jgi:hypothetical protein